MAQTNLHKVIDFIEWKAEVEPMSEDKTPEGAIVEGYLTAAQTLIASECDAIKAMLLEKNRKYGNSALNPIRVFSKASPIEQILVRLDDKLSRIKSAQPDETEDVEKDILGYLVLLRVARTLTP